jgi:hypothetical protein
VRGPALLSAMLRAAARRCEKLTPLTRTWS